MVCFLAFVYKDIPRSEVEAFVQRASYFFPGIDWAVSCGNTTVETDDLSDICNQFVNKEDPLTFQTGRIWEQMSFLRVFPRKDFSLVKPDPLFLPVAERMMENYHDEFTEVACFTPMENFPWNQVDVLLSTLNSIMPLHGYIFCEETRRIWLLKKDSSRIMFLSETDEMETVYTNVQQRICFDMDDGFFPSPFFGSHKWTVPRYLQEQFRIWCDQGKKGPVFPEQ